MWTCSLLKTNAKQALRGRYWRCFWICLVLGLVGVGGSSASTGGSRYTMDTVTGSDTAYDRVANYLDSLSYQMLMTILIVAVLAAVISLLWSIFVAAPLEVGRDRYFMESRQALSPAATVTSVFRTPYMNVVKVQFLKNLKIFVGTLLFVVPGIYWDYCYALVPYLLAENPYMTTTRAMQLSKDIMDGEKFHYFVLGLSFAGWILLCMFTLGIGYFFLEPYRQATDAELRRYAQQGIGAGPYHHRGTGRLCTPRILLMKKNQPFPACGNG